MDIQNTNWAAEMEQYLKSRINSLTYRALIKDIKVDAEGSDAILKVTIVPLDENITFGAFNIRLAGVESNTKWKKKKKDAYGTVKGYHPKVSEALRAAGLSNTDLFETWVYEYYESEDSNLEARQLSPLEAILHIQTALSEVQTPEQKRAALIEMAGGDDSGIPEDPEKAANTSLPQ